MTARSDPDSEESTVSISFENLRVYKGKHRAVRNQEPVEQTACRGGIVPTTLWLAMAQPSIKIIPERCTDDSDEEAMEESLSSSVRPPKLHGPGRNIDQRVSQCDTRKDGHVKQGVLVR